MWTLEAARDLIVDLEYRLRKIGYGIGLGGGVLLSGSSEHDLDIIVFPLDTTVQSRPALIEALNAAGLKLKFDLEYVRKMWMRKKSHDQKHVEVWETKDGKRVDIFLLS